MGQCLRGEAKTPVVVLPTIEEQIEQSEQQLKCITQWPCEYIARVQGLSLESIVHQERQDFDDDVILVTLIASAGCSGESYRYKYLRQKFTVVKMAEVVEGVTIPRVMTKVLELKEFNFECAKGDIVSLAATLDQMGYRISIEQ